MLKLYPFLIAVLLSPLVAFRWNTIVFSQPHIPVFRSTDILLAQTISDIIAWFTNATGKVSKGDEDLCIVSPGRFEEVFEVWSDRPLFLWQVEDRGELNEPRTLTIEDVGTGQPIGNPIRIPPSSQSIQSYIYDGEPLQPGQLYLWRLTNDQQSNEPGNEPEREPNYFSILPSEERDRISAELQDLIEQMPAGTSPEDRAVRQSQFFTQEQGEGKELWSDALKVMFEVSNPSPALVGVRRQVVEMLCEQQEAEQT